MKTDWCMYGTRVPGVVAHTQPFVYGGDGVAGLTDQTDPFAVGDGAPAMKVPFGTTVMAKKDYMLLGVGKLLIKDIVAYFCACLLLRKYEECVSAW